MKACRTTKIVNQAAELELTKIVRKMFTKFSVGRGVLPRFLQWFLKNISFLGILLAIANTASFC